jgi:hypothetical protein
MLMPSTLSRSFANDWLVAQGGSYPSSVTESADRFATAVAQWFSLAMAATFQCSTAAARRSQLASTAASALAAGAAPAAGQLLALAVAGYYAGQSFGAGAATFPAAISAGIALFTQAFVNLDTPQAARADLMAQACYVMAVSTIVMFPPVLPPAPIF